MDYRSWGGDYRFAHSAVVASLEVGSDACLEPLHEAFQAANLEEYSGASSADGPYEAMHGKMAKSYLSPVEPYYSPCRCQTVVAAGERHYKADEEIHDVGTHGEESHDVT